VVQSLNILQVFPEHLDRIIAQGNHLSRQDDVKITLYHVKLNLLSGPLKLLFCHAVPGLRLPESVIKRPGIYAKPELDQFEIILAVAQAHVPAVRSLTEKGHL